MKLQSPRSHSHHRANAETKDIAEAGTGARARLRAWLGLFLIAVTAATAAESGQPAALPFASEIAAFEAADRTNPPPTGAILFIGSSSIRLWKTLAADFPEHRVI